MISFNVSGERDINPTDINRLRLSVGWNADDPDIWQMQLNESLAVSSAWSEDRLIGIGFLVGTIRHASIVDVCVSPDTQRNGVGRAVVSSLVSSAHENDIRCTRLNFSADKPWLMGFYGKLGFIPETNAMTLGSSPTS